MGRENRCPICNQLADKPYRVYFEQSDNNRIIQGCVSDFHTGHLSDADLEWHNRPDAERVRKAMAERVRKVTAFGDITG